MKFDSIHSLGMAPLSGVDLKHHTLPHHEKTFLSLHDQGPVDMVGTFASLAGTCGLHIPCLRSAS